MTPGAFQKACPRCGNYSKYHDAFATKITPTGSALFYSTYLGGDGANAGYGIAVDSTDNAYVTGLTSSPAFPTMNALQPVYGGGAEDAFVSKIQVLAAATIALSSLPNPSIYGQAASFTAAVTSSAGAPPDGETVTFMKGTKALATEMISSGSASFATSSLPAGANMITAVYFGDSNFGVSTSKPVKQVVNKATTTTQLVSSLNPSSVGKSVTFTARVTPQFSGKVSGTVTFYDGTTALRSLSLSEGVAKFTTSTLTSGVHTIKATYNGNADFDSSASAPLTQTVH